MRKKIYADYAATSPLDPKVFKSMLPYLKKEFGNPSSLHAFGQRTRAAIENAREKTAKALACSPLEVVFCGGATEANNLAIRGIVHGIKSKGKKHVITSQIEHESILSPIEALEREGIVEVTYISVNSEGLIHPEDVRKALREDTILVSIGYANSEIGTIQPIAEIGKIIKERKGQEIFFHTDAVQALNFLECNVQKLYVDAMTLSGHKIYGPKGIGVLFVRNGVAMESFITGGGQEWGLRSGTENIAAIVGFGTAVEEAQSPRMKVRNIQIKQLRDFLVKGILRKIPDSHINGSLQSRLVNNINVRFDGIEGKDLAIALDQKGAAVSTGSACSEKTQEPSHVLMSLGLSPKEALSSVRITLGKYNTKEDIDQLLALLSSGVSRLRSSEG